ncbi:hypothetical protein DASC09_038820 [Saccharomycopsis crataegensis]|uniref:Uncharacterized protein n=1 Tax=Saccharomycopsis crataegensis TaxID=43959 RepID=A0AAV5QPN5_9ASCO|nr:hypothetical protein DASC09_038820 [Saccharomycopsis crataegensis]
MTKAVPLKILQIKLKRIQTYNDNLRAKLCQEKTYISNSSISVIDNCKNSIEYFLIPREYLEGESRPTRFVSVYLDQDPLIDSNLQLKCGGLCGS